MNSYQGHHETVTPDILRQLVAQHCHSEDLTSASYPGDGGIADYGDFFGCRTWRIQSHSVAAGALHKPDGTLLIDHTLEWPYLTEYVPRTIVCILDDEDGLGFYLKSGKEQQGVPDWHLMQGDFPEFEALFDELSENDFAPRDLSLTRSEMEAALRGLGFTQFEDAER